MFVHHLAFAHALPGAREGRAWPGLLSPREEALLAGLSFLPRRRKWLLGRAAAKALFARLPETAVIPPTEISVLNDPSGAPYAVLGEDRWSRCLSLSHRQSVGLAVVAGDDGIVLGADVETIEPREPALPRQFFTDDEVAWATEADVDFRVALVWSAKEAVLKLLGLGLRLDTRTIAIACSDAVSPVPGWSPLSVALAPAVAFAQPIDLIFRREGEVVVTVAWAQRSEMRRSG